MFRSKRLRTLTIAAIVTILIILVISYETEILLVAAIFAGIPAFTIFLIYWLFSAGVVFFSKPE